MTQRTAILVAGMHRSGTSALAGALNLLGVPLGNRLLEPGPDNPKGYWEHRDIVTVHERLLDALGSRWDDVRPLPVDWLSGAPAQRAAAAITEIIERDFGDAPLWAVKDPRLCRFLPLWTGVLQQLGIHPAILFMLRSPVEVSASIAARNQWLPPFGEILWLRYVTEALQASGRFPRAVVTFDALLADPVEAVRRAASRLGVALPAQRQAGRDALARFVDAGDRHHKQAVGIRAETGFSMVAEGVYQSLRKIAQGDTDWIPAERAAVQFGHEWQAQHPVLEAFGRMTVKLNRDLGDAEITLARLDSNLRAQIQWSEEAQARQEALQAERADLSSRLTAQTQWSEQAQARQEALQAEMADLSSRLTAQTQWSEQAQARQEALQAENAALSSKLAAQIRWSEDAQADRERLTAKLGDVVKQRDSLAADLQSARAKAAEAQERLTAKLGGVAKERDNLAADLRRTRAEAADVRALLKAELDAANGRCDRLAEAVGRATSEKNALAATLDSIYASRSWRLTRPLRAIAGLLTKRPKT